MLFKNRKEAADILIPYLDRYRNKNSIVLAIPRGGVPIAYAVAKAYSWPMDLLMAKKIGHPTHPEFAIGAVTPEDYSIDDHTDVPQSYVDTEVHRIQKSLKDKYRQFTEGRKPINIENKTAIIIDDGLATGNTILAAIEVLRKQNPAKIVVAIPVAPWESAEKIRQYVDDFVCLYTPQPFFGVGTHYSDFAQVSDEEVMKLLRNAHRFASEKNKENGPH